MEFNLLKLLGLPVFAYLLGAIPFGLVLTRIFTAVDIRHAGSGNIGANNVRRLAGMPLAVLTLAGDVLKGFVPALIALSAGIEDHAWQDVYTCIVAFSAFSGHLYPVYLRFRSGGKGVATAAGCFLVISPAACFVSILVYVLCICMFSRSSVGSLGASAVLPIAVWKASASVVISGFAILVAAMIFIRHRDNIKRLVAGTEPTI
jgi:acyl phosphate:glycerol-3-phosphate acyltransferase